MKMMKAYIRPQKEREVLNALTENGIHGATFKSILGRGKQRGLKVSGVYYDEIPKSLLMIAVEDTKVEMVKGLISSICKQEKTGAYGDGKIFTIPIEKVITISSGKIEV
jgi:nitrogen regulatory protein PII 1